MTKPYIDPDRDELLEARKRLNRFISSALLVLGRNVARQVARWVTGVRKAEPTIEDLLAAIDIEFDEDLSDDLVDELGRVYSSSGKLALTQVGVATADELVNQINEGAISWAERHVGELIGINGGSNWVSDATRRMIRTTIVDGMRNNLSSESIAEEIEKNYAFSEERAELIAMTEVATANSMGALEGYQVAEKEGVKVGKSWLILETACAVCHMNADQGVIPLDEPFQSGDMTPPAHPNCRCVIVPESGFEKLTKTTIKLRGWDESKHPREPKGTSEGGRFAPAVPEMGWRNPLNPHEQIIESGEKVGGLNVSIFEGMWHITEVRAITRGGGRVAMERLLEEADKLGVSVELFAVPLQSPGGIEMTPARLEAWYGGFGFSPDPDRGAMVRNPKMKKWDESKHPRDPGGEDGGQFVPKQSMSEEEIGVLEDYMVSSFVGINEGSRNGSLAGDAARDAAILDSISTDYLSGDTVLYRRSIHPLSAIKDTGGRPLTSRFVGNVEMPGFTSTSFRRDVVEDFGTAALGGRTDILWEIEAPKGTRGIDVSARLAANNRDDLMGSQAEFILPRKTRLHVLSISRNKPNEFRVRARVAHQPAMMSKADWNESKHPRHPTGSSSGGRFMNVAEFSALPDYSEDPEGKLDGAEPGDAKNPLPMDDDVETDAMVAEMVAVHARAHASRADLENQYMAVGEFSPEDKDLLTYQRMVGKDKVLDIAQNGPANPNEPLPHVARYKGRFILLDGNHRTVASFLQGRTQQANILFVDKYFEDNPKLRAEWENIYKFTKADWDESKHPRHPAGTEQGGEFKSNDNAAEAALRQHRDSWYLLAEKSGISGPGTPGHFENWLLEEGEEFGPRIDLPKGVTMGQQKLCYMNSYQALLHGAVDRSEWFYTEGVISIPGLPITIEHAWLSNRKGEVLDLTLRNGDNSAYWGIPYDFDYVSARTLEHGHYGLHSDGVRRYPDLVGQPVADARAWPKGKR